MKSRVVLATHPPGDKAAELGRTLVEQGLAACVNIVPSIHSIYQWQGKLEQDAECLLIMKTSVEQLPALEEAYLKLHPYDTPSFVVLHPEHVTPRYAAWIEDVVSGEKDS